jgi:hypothetical protein
MRKLQSDLQARSHDLEVYIPYVSVIPRNPYDVNTLCNIETPLNSHLCLTFFQCNSSLPVTLYLGHGTTRNSHAPGVNEREVSRGGSRCSRKN